MVLKNCRLLTQADELKLLLLTLAFFTLSNGSMLTPTVTHFSDDFEETESPQPVTPIGDPNYFDLQASSNVTALQGQTGFLTCRIRRRGNWTVSWVRHKDIHLLAVGTETYTKDPRFKAHFVQSSGDWTLQIKGLISSDVGAYECQLSTTPLRGHTVYLSVLIPETRIMNGNEVFLEQGSELNLTCLVSPGMDPSLILWRHNGRVVNWERQQAGADPSHLHQVIYQSRQHRERHHGASRIRIVDDPVHNPISKEAVSHLIVRKSKPFHSGQYACSPPGAEGASTIVHVIAEEEPAAMQRGTAPCQNPCQTVLFTILCLVVFYINSFKRHK
ncbi:zwei Ig domain protein zig-8-like [Artemia franciscana]|uniref:Ig-like domain-containing protein n=1 Tax=Artemia franciscana TaxID=6661 RepID=A0AA88IBV7_ARTSF|nr:hypothetical protein QYM36_000716 [Artemia franciscana]